MSAYIRFLGKTDIPNQFLEKFIVERFHDFIMGYSLLWINIDPSDFEFGCKKNYRRVFTDNIHIQNEQFDSSTSQRNFFTL